MSISKSNTITVSYTVFYVFLSLIYSIIFVGAEFWGSPVAGFRGFMTLALQWVVVSFAASSVIGLISMNRWIFAMTFPILILLSTIAAYFKITLGASITPSIIELAVVNNANTWFTLVSPALMVFVIVAMTLSIAMAIYRFRFVHNPKYKIVWLVCFLAGTLVLINIKRFKAPITGRMPFSFVWSVWDYGINRRAVSEIRNTFDNVPVTCADDSITVVVVIGESLRSDHLQINGYGRCTMPLLCADTAVVSLPKMRTVPYYTHVSVPHIVTRADSIHPDRASEEQSFISLFKKAGFHTAWLSNQDEVVSYTYFMHEADELIRINSARSLYDFGLQLDEDLLPEFDDFLKRSEPRKLGVLHTIGSHWWYGSHYREEDACFKPEANSRIVSELTADQIINSYDNTIVATDKFLNAILTRLRDKNAVLLYVSDHGEALGENGNFLHGADYPELHNTASFVWYSSKYAERHADLIKGLKMNSVSNYMTDVIFHSVLDAATISTPVLDYGMSVFR